MFVTIAVFEYAVLLAIRFGKRRIATMEESATRATAKCNRVDGFFLRIIMGIYIITVTIYFCVVSQIN